MFINNFIETVGEYIVSSLYLALIKSCMAFKCFRMAFYCEMGATSPEIKTPSAKIIDFNFQIKH